MMRKKAALQSINDALNDLAPQWIWAIPIEFLNYCRSFPSIYFMLTIRVFLGHVVFYPLHLVDDIQTHPL